MKRFDKKLEINPIFGNNGLKEARHYIFDLILPGKAQNQYYTDSFFNKIRSLIIGLGAYYFAYQAIDAYDNYEIYNSEYHRFSDLYNNATNSEDISFYKNEVLKSKDSTLIVSIEAGITDGWQKYTGRNGLNIGINTFGESAPGAEVANHFGLTVDNLYNQIIKRLESK